MSRVGDGSLMDVIAQWNSASPVQHNVIIFDNVSVTPKNRGKVWPLSCRILPTDLFRRPTMSFGGPAPSSPSGHHIT